MIWRRLDKAGASATIRAAAPAPGNPDPLDVAARFLYPARPCDCWSGAPTASSSGSAALARNLGVPPLLIGLTVVGFGTSAPEMLVSTMAALQGNPGLAIGNAIGSNIANIALILGATALIAPLTVQVRHAAARIPPAARGECRRFLLLLRRRPRSPGRRHAAGRPGRHHVAAGPHRPAPPRQRPAGRRDGGRDPDGTALDRGRLVRASAWPY